MKGLKIGDVYVTEEERETAFNNGVTESNLSWRIRHGWSKEKAIETEIRKWDNVPYEALEKNNIPLKNYLARVYRGWSKEKASTTPVKKKRSSITKVYWSKSSGETNGKYVCMSEFYEEGEK